MRISKKKFEYYSDGLSIWFYYGKTRRFNKFVIPDEIIEKIKFKAQEDLRKSLRELLGVDL